MKKRNPQKYKYLYMLMFLASLFMTWEYSPVLTVSEPSTMRQITFWMWFSQIFLWGILFVLTMRVGRKNKK